LRKILMFVAGLLALAGTATAQVAAPQFNPAMDLLGPLTNPGVLIWNVSSRIGASYTKAEIDSPPGTRWADGSIRTLDAVYVGQRVAVGGFAGKQPTNVIGFGTINADVSVVQAAVQFSQRFSLGLGQEHVHETGPGGLADTFSQPEAGATLRLGSLLFLGGSVGRETISVQGLPSEKSNMDSEGVGIYSRGPGGGVHLEAFRQRQAATATIASGSTITGATAEALWGPVLLSAEAQKRDYISPGGGGVFQTDHDSTFALGWMPQHGLTLVLSVTKETSKDPSGVALSEAKYKTVGVTWLY
jgi:hypothetical protein